MTTVDTQMHDDQKQAKIAASASQSSQQYEYTNDLIHEKSPYLLQHAHNPVNWMPWGEAAFKKARDENRMIFLSSGYSTCHWCHVMEHESFENNYIANLINSNFVPIKVDREERQDVDRTYMTFVQATTGSGGWPLNVFLTPDLKPVFGGTYFAPTERGGYGQISFPHLLMTLAKKWQTNPRALIQSANEVTELFQQEEQKGNTVSDLNQLSGTFDKCFQQLRGTYDEKNGGFSKAPKFPSPSNFHFLFRYWKVKVTGDSASQRQAKDALSMCIRTLTKMSRGGIYDQLGGGFHRYSVTQGWEIPHYEKMMYDQGQLATAYLEAYQITKEKRFEKICRETVDYILRDMTDQQTGGFYCAEDADSEPPLGRENTTGKKKLEGAWAVWTKSEIESALGDNAQLFCQFYDIKDRGNAPAGSDPHGELKNTNTLRQVTSKKKFAEQHNISEEDLTKLINECRCKLFGLRQQRPKPHLDDKIVLSWNALTISALCKAAQVLREDRYAQAAVRAANFIRNQMVDKASAKLLRSYRNGPSNIFAFCEDYCYFVASLLDLYECTTDIGWLEFAKLIQNKQDELFWDAEKKSYFNEEADKVILFRSKEDSDGVMPAENSVAAYNLLRMYKYFNSDSYRDRACDIFTSHSSVLQQYPAAFTLMLSSFYFLDHSAQVILADSRPMHSALRHSIQSTFHPFIVLMFADQSEGQAKLSTTNELFNDITMREDKSTVYLCAHQTCQAPVTDPDQVKKLLEPY